MPNVKEKWPTLVFFEKCGEKCVSFHLSKKDAKGYAKSHKVGPCQFIEVGGSLSCSYGGVNIFCRNSTLAK
jgi:hypothetical protein